MKCIKVVARLLATFLWMKPPYSRPALCVMVSEPVLIVGIPGTGRSHHRTAAKHPFLSRGRNGSGIHDGCHQSCDLPGG
jgi:hypothetical protein